MDAIIREFLVESREGLDPISARPPAKYLSLG